MKIRRDSRSSAPRKPFSKAAMRALSDDELTMLCKRNSHDYWVRVLPLMVLFYAMIGVTFLANHLAGFAAGMCVLIITMAIFFVMAGFVFVGVVRSSRVSFERARRRRRGRVGQV